MSLLDRLKDKLGKAQEQGALSVEDADAVVGIAEGIDDEAALRLFKTGLLLLPKAVALSIYWALVALDNVIPEALQEKLYLDELEAAAKTQIA